ncbi:GNAT family N-acetyltransferase [Rhodococcus sp. ZPP]|uniref:GNAT family N-acetyltransferase n=1 Tax=Rhodococcus sp. ZPP TaxID=2749906 RepID=UPI001AD8588D|nr:GNAT family protein [Rhodococcus sp. ZPP]QTJ67097.1 GNAT family N-acetyltransferase [Rhodococcus sp. ZPP]
MSESWFARPTLTGTHVRLEPLCDDHVDALLAAVDDPRIFHWTSVDITDRKDAATFVRAANEDPTRLAYAQIDLATNILVGSTSYYLIDPRNRCLAIGHTWLSRSAQGTLINADSKLLLLRRAFEDLGAVRVEWHTDERNAHSRGAIAKLGAEFEGILRKHRRRRDGSWRNTALFSMTDDDWPRVCPRLQARVEG